MKEANSACLSARGRKSVFAQPSPVHSVPEGHPRIARRLNAGIRPQRNPVPKGRLKTRNHPGRPFGHTRQATMRSARSNPNGVVKQSPGLALRQPWVIAWQCPTTPTGLRPGDRKTSRLRSPPATTPLGLMAPLSPVPRVVPSVQPWALLHNRVAVEAAHSKGFGDSKTRLAFARLLRARPEDPGSESLSPPFVQNRTIRLGLADHSTSA
jgi:hypothetical protein